MSVENRALGERIAAAKREIRANSMDGIERRLVPGKVEERDGEDGTWQIAGYGYVFNSMSENLGGFREIIAPGAGVDVFAGSPDIRGLINHNPDLILGRTSAGTMQAGEDEHGGWYVIDAPDTSYANDLRVSLRRGDVTQSSFAFRVARGGEVWDEDVDTGLLLRTITKFSGLYDESPVTYPAYSDTTSAERSTPADERGSDEDAIQRASNGDGEDGPVDEVPASVPALTPAHARARLKLRGKALQR